ncbi:MAG: hypothetical protein IPL53_06685 [Ignavibacteria bacterium]|nr:hypothetical protein [Ignavibacteria bacterium]
MKYEKTNNAEKGKLKKKRRSSLENLSLLLPSELITNADSYLHYSNQLLFEINRSETAALLVIMIFFNNASAQHVMAIVLSQYENEDKPRIFYAEFKEFTKSFDGVIERYCGVPP